MRYRLGLDIGIASVGWSVLEHDEHDNPCRIVDLGVRIFDPVEVPKTGESPSVERRNARAIRRSVRRKRSRLDNLTCFLKDKLLEGKDIEFLPVDVYQLRADALDKKLSDNDLARVLFHISKHRGFKSNRKSELKQSDNKKMLGSINKLSEDVKSYRTIGEMYCKDERFFVIKEKVIRDEVKKIKVYNTRNRDGEYDKTLLRADVLNEVKVILESQKSFGNDKIDDNFITKVLHYIDYQKSYDEGPDYPSPYHVTFNVGECTFLKNEKRAPKGAFSQEYFTALCELNNMSIDGKPLDEEQRKILLDAFFKSEEIKYEKVRKLLKLDEGAKITGKSGSDDNKKVFIKRKNSYQILKALNLEQEPLKYHELLDEVAYVISMFKSDSRRMKQFRALECLNGFSEELIENLCAVDFNKFGNLSIKALKLIIPYLEKGQKYQEACLSAGLTQSFGNKNRKLKFNELTEIEDITSPVVRRAVSQTIKVVNALIDKFGSPEAIFIELGRDMSRDFKERKQIEKSQLANSQVNEEIYNRLKNEFGITYPSGQDIVKLKLYEEQNGICAYSGKSFVSVFGNNLSALFSDNNTQIDHIIPYSRCFDDSYNNKVLVLSSENQKKGNRLPYEYLSEDKEKWNEFVARTYTLYEDKKKKMSNLLKNSLSLEQERELNNRALNDTRYICKFIKNLLENHLLFAESSFSKKPVRTINGAMTSFLRKIWGLPKSRFADDKHHAVDATIVASTDNGMIQRVTTFMRTKGGYKRDNQESVFVDKSTGEVFSVEETVNKFGKNYQMPYETFKSELELRIASDLMERKAELLKLGYSSEELDEVRPLNVSRMVNHKVTGAIHKQTIRSKKLINEDSKKLFVVTKTKLTDLKLDKDGEIVDYPEKFRTDDKRLYEALKKRLYEFDGNAKEAFKEPFYKPAKNKSCQNQVKSVKLQKTINDGVEVNGGIAENGSMIRIDVFENKSKFYFIPVYVKDFYNKQLPNKICKAGCLYKDWSELDESYTFKFSLFKNDIIKICSKKGFNFVPCDKKAKKEIFVFNDLLVYYKCANRATSSISFETIDGKYQAEGVGIQNLLQFDKFEIDLLGNIRSVKHESRKEFK